jgi:hypothetical protein
MMANIWSSDRTPATPQKKPIKPLRQENKLVCGNLKSDIDMSFPFTTKQKHFSQSRTFFQNIEKKLAAVYVAFAKKLNGKYCFVDKMETKTKMGFHTNFFSHKSKCSN